MRRNSKLRLLKKTASLLLAGILLPEALPDAEQRRIKAKTRQLL